MIRNAAAIMALAALASAAGAAGTGIVVGIQLEPPSLDPTSEAAAATDEVVYANIYEGLTRFGPQGEILPGLAESWEIAPDGLSYTFTLRPGVTFHNGQTLTADDVVFSFDRAMADGSLNAQKALFDPILEVAANDDLNVEITLKQPIGALPFNLAWGDAVIVDESFGDAERQVPNGTGPFRFSRWVQGDRIELVRNDAYWGTPAALETATFKVIADPTAAFAAMMTGEVHAFPVYPAPENLAQFEADPRFRVIVGNTEGETILAINNRHPALSDVRVRRAIAHAIDRQAVIDGAMFGYGTPIGTHFAPHHPAYLDLTGQSLFAPDLSRALLQEAGTTDLRLTLKLPPPTYARRGGEIIASQLRAVGIDVRIQNIEWAQWLEEVFTNGDFDLTVISHTEPMDIGIYARDDYYFGHHDAAVQALMKGLDFFADDSDRAVILQAVQKRIADTYVNAWLFQLAKTGVADARLEGLWDNAPTQANDLTAVRWRE
jgi:peptide/nickel transport system substrate-binding protein